MFKEQCYCQGTIWKCGWLEVYYSQATGITADTIYAPYLRLNPTETRRRKKEKCGYVEFLALWL